MYGEKISCHQWWKRGSPAQWGSTIEYTYCARAVLSSEKLVKAAFLLEVKSDGERRAAYSNFNEKNFPTCILLQLDVHKKSKYNSET
jgi:hypothetical protein